MSSSVAEAIKASEWFDLSHVQAMLVATSAGAMKTLTLRQPYLSIFQHDTFSRAMP
jgi:hypothetical protein